jgi:hypothetical protein
MFPPLLSFQYTHIFLQLCDKSLGFYGVFTFVKDGRGGNGAWGIGHGA